MVVPVVTLRGLVTLVTGVTGGMAVTHILMVDITTVLLVVLAD